MQPELEEVGSSLNAILLRYRELAQGGPIDDTIHASLARGFVDRRSSARSVEQELERLQKVLVALNRWDALREQLLLWLTEKDLALTRIEMGHGNDDDVPEVAGSVSLVLVYIVVSSVVYGTARTGGHFLQLPARVPCFALYLGSAHALELRETPKHCRR